MKENNQSGKEMKAMPISHPLHEIVGKVVAEIPLTRCRVLRDRASGGEPRVIDLSLRKF